jgi:hypothetical protein
VLLLAARKLIAILDVVPDIRRLSAEEIRLKRDLKARLLGLTAIEKLRAKQHSTLTSIKTIEANSKLFFLHLNGRRRKNHIQTLATPEGLLHTHEDKEMHIFQHFNTQFGKRRTRASTLDWHRINLPRLDLSSLEANFSEEEVRVVITDMASDKAPGPDGFIGAFFKSAWQIVKNDILAAVNFFYQQHSQHLKHLNSAHLVLLPKKLEAETLCDFRPISPTHNIAKLLSKLLANRLAPFLNELVSRQQSAFIKKQSIGDNFLYTQNLIKALHRSKRPALFLKLDIAKAFDSVRWDFCLKFFNIWVLALGGGHGYPVY